MKNRSVRLASVLLVAVLAFCSARCSSPAPSQLRPMATIKDIMDSVVDPSADAIWDSVATVVNATGSHDRQPRTDEDWANLRKHAVALVEGPNLRVMEGRHVAQAGEKAANNNVELTAAEIEATIRQDRQAWIDFAHKLQDAALPALKAIDERNVDALLDAGEHIDVACENCHLKYWYPPSKQEEAKKSGAADPRKQ